MALTVLPVLWLLGHNVPGMGRVPLA